VVLRHGTNNMFQKFLISFSGLDILDPEQRVAWLVFETHNANNASIFSLK